jgi:hypothetical protein
MAIGPGLNNSGTYNFFPSTGELVLAAFARIGIRRAEILQEHMQNAMNEINLMQVDWACDGPLLWTVELVTNTLVQGQSVYSVPQNVVMILDAYISINNVPAVTPPLYTDRIIWPFSRTEWASTPNKTQQGAPTSFWFDRLVEGTVTLWPVPDGSEALFSYYAFTNVQDAVISNATSAQIPYLWLNAFVSGLAHRMARIYAPSMEQIRGADAATAYEKASRQYVENVPLYISPTVYQYWR